MKLCAVQYEPVKGDIAANVLRHAAFVEQAAAHGGGLIVFPELSLTGYEPTLAEALATHPQDPRLNALQHLSDAHGIVIGAGLPLVSAGKPLIGMVLFQPGSERLAYAKQQLHVDELPYFSPAKAPLVLDLGDHRRIAPAICYESLQPGHAATAAELGATVYLASVAKQASGMEAAHAHYATMAREHGMTVLLANCLGPCDDYVGAGRSAAWSAQGERIASLDGQREGVLMIDSPYHDAKRA